MDELLYLPLLYLLCLDSSNVPPKKPQKGERLKTTVAGMVKKRYKYSTDRSKLKKNTLASRNLLFFQYPGAVLK